MHPGAASSTAVAVKITLMIRVSELKIPLKTGQTTEPAEADLIPYICAALGIKPAQLLSHCTYKRSYDARRSVMALTYIVDCTVLDEAALLATHRDNPQVKVSPDIAYYPVGQAPDTLLPQQRPVVVGFGPCGIFAALTNVVRYRRLRFGYKKTVENVMFSTVSGKWRITGSNR